MQTLCLWISPSRQVACWENGPSPLPFGHTRVKLQCCTLCPLPGAHTPTQESVNWVSLLLLCSSAQRIREASCGEWARTGWKGGQGRPSHLPVPLLKAGVSAFINFRLPVSHPAQVTYSSRVSWSDIWSPPVSSGKSEVAAQMDSSYLQKIHLHSRPLGVCAVTPSWGPARIPFERWLP